MTLRAQLCSFWLSNMSESCLRGIIKHSVPEALDNFVSRSKFAKKSIDRTPPHPPTLAGGRT